MALEQRWRPELAGGGGVGPRLKAGPATMPSASPCSNGGGWEQWRGDGSPGDWSANLKTR